MEEIISQEELEDKFQEWYDNAYKRDAGLSKGSCYDGFMAGAKLVLEYAAHMNYECYHCGKTTSDVVYVMIADKDNTAKQVPICKDCYNRLMKDNPDD